MTEMLAEITHEGKVIKLMDGSEWAINPGDIPTSITWSPTDNIKVEKDKNADDMFNHRLTNLANKIYVYAMSKGTDDNIYSL